MILYILSIIFGSILFEYGFRLLRKSKNDKESLRIYGFFAYIGTAFFIWGISQIIGNYLINSFTIFHGVILFALFELAAFFLLKPGFKEK